MIVPSGPSTLPWPQQPSWRTFAGQLFRFYSRKSNFTVLITRRGGTAAVDPVSKVVYLDPDLLPVTDPGVIRHAPGDEHGIRALLLRAILAHEAGHVQFSGDKPPALLGQLWNALEDERMERLMAARYPELAPAFDFLGDTLAEKVSLKWRFDSLEGCLAMRFEHDRAAPKWAPARLDEWADIWPLVQAAWTAPDSDRVTWIAGCILGLLGLDQADERDPFGGLVGSDGAGDPDRQQPGDDGDGTPEGGRSPGGQGSRDPGDRPPPDPAPDPTDILTVGDVEGPARLVASVLRERARPGRTRPHETRGNLDLTRYIEGRSRLFRQRQEPTRPSELHVTWIVDRSGSMNEEGRMGCAVRALHMGIRAAQIADVPVRVIAFDDVVEEPVPFGLSPAAATSALCTIFPRGYTELAPAMRRAFESPRRAGEQHLHIVICDGGLDAEDMAACGRLIGDHRDVRVLPVLIGEAANGSVAQAWQVTFGTLLLAHDHTQLAGVIRARMRAFRH
ncbi:vWA domain-containing protein [Deinococcus sp. YIM 134068]|uniref:vWA domain-containing protein n=1 Tax=Deinococcus lichenicola TaxID=3118910 RepID=UPI002F92FB0F